MQNCTGLHIYKKVKHLLNGILISESYSCEITIKVVVIKYNSAKKNYKKIKSKS